MTTRKDGQLLENFEKEKFNCQVTFADRKIMVQRQKFSCQISLTDKEGMLFGSDNDVCDTDKENDEFRDV